MQDTDPGRGKEIGVVPVPFVVLAPPEQALCSSKHVLVGNQNNLEVPGPFEWAPAPKLNSQLIN